MQIETEKCGCLSQNYFFFSNLVDVIAALITSFLKPNSTSWFQKYALTCKLQQKWMENVWENSVWKKVMYAFRKLK